MTSRQLIWTAIILLLLILSGIGYYVALRSGLLGDRYTGASQQGEVTTGEQAPGADGMVKDQSRVPPTLDIVRVEPTGETVVAGRAAPGATVRLEKEGAVIGEAVANNAGEWVIVPDAPLGAGSSEVDLVAVMEDGTEVPSEESIVIEVGEGGQSQPLVVVTRGDAPSEVMQAPGLTEGESAAEGGTAVAAAEPAAEAASPAGDATVARDDDAAEGAATELAEAETAAQPQDGSGGQGTESAAPEGGAMNAENADGSSGGADVSVAAEEAAPATAEAEAAAGAEAASPVQVQTVESDSEGRIFASGMASPGSSVQVYLDNEVLGTAEADAEGRWEIAAAKPLAPGEYDVRVDQIGASGAVEARSQVVFSQAEPVAAAAGTELVATTAPDSVQLQKLEIRRGDNLWRISRRLYGRGIRYTVIYDANRNVITDPDLIFPGQVFVIPPDELPRESGVQNN